MNKEFKETITFYQIDKWERDSSGRACFRISLKNIPNDQELIMLRDFISEAFNAVNQTGKTPKELQEENEKLKAILKEITYKSGFGYFIGQIPDTLVEGLTDDLLESLTKTK